MKLLSGSRRLASALNCGKRKAKDDVFEDSSPEDSVVFEKVEKLTELKDDELGNEAADQVVFEKSVSIVDKEEREDVDADDEKPPHPIMRDMMEQYNDDESVRVLTPQLLLKHNFNRTPKVEQEDREPVEDEEEDKPTLVRFMSHTEGKEKGFEIMLNDFNDFLGTVATRFKDISAHFPQTCHEEEEDDDDKEEETPQEGESNVPPVNMEDLQISSNKESLFRKFRSSPQFSRKGYSAKREAATMERKSSRVSNIAPVQEDDEDDKALVSDFVMSKAGLPPIGNKGSSVSASSSKVESAAE